MMQQNHKNFSERRRHSAFSLCIPGGDTSASYHDFFESDEVENPSTSEGVLDFSCVQKNGDCALGFQVDRNDCTCDGGIYCSFCLLTRAPQLCSTFNLGPLCFKIPVRRRGSARESRSEEHLSSVRGRNIAKASNSKTSKPKKAYTMEAFIFSLVPTVHYRGSRLHPPHRLLARSRSVSGPSSRIPLSTALSSMVEKAAEYHDDVVFGAPGGPVTKQLSLQNLTLSDEPPIGEAFIVTNYEDDLCSRLNGLHSPNYEDVILDENVSHLEAEMESCTISPI